MSHTFSFEAIGTKWNIDLFEVISPEQHTELQSAILSRIGVFDAHYSRFRDDSLVMTIARDGGTHTMPPDFAAMFSIYRQLYNITGGKMTPLIGNLLVDLGYDAAYSLVPQEAPRDVLVWDDVLTYANSQLSVSQPVILDFGAAGKGYLIDIVSEVIEGFGIAAYCVEAGGDMRVRSESPLTIGLENPHNFKEIIGTVSLTEGSVCGSAGSRRVWAGYHHILDPDKKESPMHLSAVWTKASTTLLADALSTALFFVTPEKLLPFFEFEYILLYSNGTLESSPGFQASFY